MGADRRMKGHPSKSALPSHHKIQQTGSSLHHDQSDGILTLCDGDTMRKEGNSLIARQVELENMKVRQFKAKQQVSNKNLSLRQEQKMNVMLDKIHRENFEVE
mmetsp:Transcript_14856/g.18614  ORF Transcript_14856/g.18614 Transcript_14856/m.18614 type:complete len:103 (-) Transcript_14856:388-696(-)|eukprot:CAMPEP_0170455310 /NCGR_PEP_ID=MMETSP0123-20130129/3320_1 /TAXON_ID=182087 /ORGANISM="Favella ehrenbergii, Strain Fehren 1" /LENGTH=102 /DNA_ID=CAMNT_0010718411 /DNA_START=1677 /DNA_END=1985 /DNA_ORIENTATION=+